MMRGGVLMVLMVRSGRGNHPRYTFNGILFPVENKTKVLTGLQDGWCYSLSPSCR